MSNLLEITGQDLAQLGDTQLRELIGLLCEADYRQAGLPTRGITWGGHQDAADGGLDVVVRDKIKPPQNSFILRSSTGFQVKKPDMKKADITSEMRPKGELRDSIKKLISENGAYVIASSGANTTGTALNDRIDAMRSAVADTENHQNIELNFLDCNRIATWVRSHPFMILWVREKIGRQLEGWRPYQNWANPKAGIHEEYLIDERLRLHSGIKTLDDGWQVKDGIIKLREALSVPGSSVRLAGLSGVGKTRLVQALFDERIEGNLLNSSLAFYTDISDEPIPNPKSFAEQLKANRTRAILIVDNCPPELHNSLTKTCSTSNSNISLLTVEYDVADDSNENTSVFRLEPASEELIEELVRKRFGHISQVDAITIANLSGGNARIAISLANTLNKGESFSGLREKDLFERLFQQRNAPSESLLESAKVCSLVYSFDGEKTDEESELRFLASIIDKPVKEVYRDIAILKGRELVQARNKWRAVLPHGIANWLAEQALETIPTDTVVNAFIRKGTERLIKSFTRRLHYLHDCKKAVEIVNDMLQPKGWLGQANCNFTSLGMTAFKNIAPVSPEKTLESIEGAANGKDGAWFTSRENTNYSEFVQILRHIAYDPDLFHRSVDVICRFSLREENDENYNSSRPVLKSLFHLYLSGTHATVESRAKVIIDLVNSGNKEKQELGLSLLAVTLEAWHFSSSFLFDFGAQKRDYGYEPKTSDERQNWYRTFLSICEDIALKDTTIRDKARKIIADNMRGLWTKVGLFDELESLSIKLQEVKPWNDGWVAVKGILKFDGKIMDEKILTKLKKIEATLRPENLLEKARVYALSKQHRTISLEDAFEDEDDATSGWKKVFEDTKKIGAMVAKDEKILSQLLPGLFTPDCPRLGNFGEGLVAGYDDKLKLWGILREQFIENDTEDKSISIFFGFLYGIAKIDPELHDKILDGLIHDEVLCEYFPSFEATAEIGKKGIERLNAVLDAGCAKIQHFETLSYGRAHEPISDDDLAALLRKIASKDGGVEVAIRILQMRFFGNKNKAHDYSKDLINAGCEIMSAYQFPSEHMGRQNKLDYELAQIGSICFEGKQGTVTAKELCTKIVKLLVPNGLYLYHYSGLLACLASKQPLIFLNEFFGNDEVKDYQRRRMLDAHDDIRANPLGSISDENIISWCETEPEKRYPVISSAIRAFSKPDKEADWKWDPIVYSILDNAPDLTPVLNNLAILIKPRSWSGSLANILQKRIVLLISLSEHENEEVRAWAQVTLIDLQETIQKEREWEKKRGRNREHESFE